MTIVLVRREISSNGVKLFLALFRLSNRIHRNYPTMAPEYYPCWRNVNFYYILRLWEYGNLCRLNCWRLERGRNCGYTNHIDTNTIITYLDVDRIVVSMDDRICDASFKTGAWKKVRVWTIWLVDRFISTVTCHSPAVDGAVGCWNTAWNNCLDLQCNKIRT